MAYLGVSVSLLDRAVYSEFKFYDLCQMSVIHSEEAKQLTVMVRDELHQLDQNRAKLDLSDPFTRFQIDTAYVEFEYVTALRLLQLARWHQGDFHASGFHCGQTRITMNDRVVRLTNVVIELQNKARRVGISVEFFRSTYT
jgi:hypothetical protein